MENLKQALQVLINIAEKTDSAWADKHISIPEGVGITISAIGLIKVIKSFPEIEQEYKAMNDAQKADLEKWFASEFQLNDKKVEGIIEEVFDALLDFNKVFGHIKSAA